jgi:FHA domain-containing protein
MSGMERLLAKVKALFAPSRAETPAQQVEVTAPPPAPVRPVAEVAEPPAPEPVATIYESLPQEAPVFAEAPAVIEEAQALAEELPTPIEEARTELEPALADGVTLRLANERGSPSTFQVTKSGATIGRGPESTIQLADLSVSRKHARIAYKQGAYWLSDLGSMGGTWVDGTKLAAPRRVEAGQTIDIGLCRLVVVAAVEGEKTGAAKGPSNAA